MLMHINSHAGLLSWFVVHFVLLGNLSAILYDIFGKKESVIFHIMKFSKLRLFLKVALHTRIEFGKMEQKKLPGKRKTGEWKHVPR